MPQNVDLGTSDLNTITALGSYRQYSNANATTARNYPVSDSRGILEVAHLVNGSNLMQRYTPLTNTDALRGVYTRLMLNGTFGPWRFIASQRVDQTAGRAIYTWDNLNGREQLVYGDTGSRALAAQNVSSLGAMRLRRRGSLVELVVVAAVTSVAGNVNLLVEALPSGFRPGNSRIVAAIRNGLPSQAGLANDGSNFTVYGAAVGDTWSTTITFLTPDAWPTILPGTAVGTIPNL